MSDSGTGEEGRKGRKVTLGSFERTEKRSRA